MGRKSEKLGGKKRGERKKERESWREVEGREVEGREGEGREGNREGEGEGRQPHISSLRASLTVAALPHVSSGLLSLFLEHKALCAWF